MPDCLNKQLRTSAEQPFDDDWKRQRRTANDILQRLKTQEGVILADQVGMGKTYVALAVAASQILSTPDLGQVVIFVPAAVADKWVREWRKFSESLLEPGSGIRCVDHALRSGEELLKKLDDHTNERAHIIVVTHTALTSSLKDDFIQLALLHHATRHLKTGAELRQRIAKWSTGNSGLFRNSRFKDAKDVVKLLDTPPSNWRATWQIRTGEELADDPVPGALERAVKKISLKELKATIEALPIRSSVGIKERLNDAREALNAATQVAWKWMLSSTDLDLPLLIVDEAHRLKNPDTNIGRLFGKRSVDPKDGALDGTFRRMLFMTATPFELGHKELIQVLGRMDAVRPLEQPELPSLPERLKVLEKVLTEAQSKADGLDKAWGRLSIDEVAVFDTWSPTAIAPAGIAAVAREAWEHAKLAVKARKEMHQALKPWIIRHERERRRDYQCGAAISTDGDKKSGGLATPEHLALPFLLAARAQALAIDEKQERPYFAYGIASSFEAFLRSGVDRDERDSDEAEREKDGDSETLSEQIPAAGAIGWYQGEIARALKSERVRDGHPKIQATVEKAAQLWLEGEKCLIFCWYIRTGEVVERALTTRIDGLIAEKAAAALGTDSPEETKTELDRIANRLFRSDSASYEHLRQRLREALFEAAGCNDDVVDLVVDSAIRHLRTPSYLVRYTELSRTIDDEQVWAGICGANPRGIVLLERWRVFAERLASARTQFEKAHAEDAHDGEFARIHDALLGAESEEEHAAQRGAKLVPVRRASGGTAREIRERLIAVFNTPLFPDVLVASSVMGEGIDLHLECRFVIHHDLDWNPSVLEQRTGRLDRIGALAEREDKNIVVYEPYLAGTHDEKMFLVVKDRAQWFDIVMGRATGLEEAATDAEENRAPLHKTILDALAMNLRSKAIEG